MAPGSKALSKSKIFVDFIPSPITFATLFKTITYMHRTLVFGASTNPDRYSNRAIKRLSESGHEVLAIGGKEGRVGEVEILIGHPELNNIDTITIYMNAYRLQEHEEYLLSLNPRRIIFNPGAENRHFAYKARAQGTETLDACTLVMLSVGDYDLVTDTTE